MKIEIAFGITTLISIAMLACFGISVKTMNKQDTKYNHLQSSYDSLKTVLHNDSLQYAVKDSINIQRALGEGFAIGWKIGYDVNDCVRWHRTLGINIDDLLSSANKLANNWGYYVTDKGYLREIEK